MSFNSVWQSHVFLSQAPANYEGIDFQTRALQQSKIDLTWDENEPQRSKKLDKINADEVRKAVMGIVKTKSCFIPV